MLELVLMAAVAAMGFAHWRFAVATIKRLDSHSSRLDFLRVDLNVLEKRTYIAKSNNAAPEGEHYLDENKQPNGSDAWLP